MIAEVDKNMDLLCIGEVSVTDRQVAERLDAWWKENLCINEKKTDKIIVDFRKSQTSTLPLLIREAAVCFKYLTHL